MSKLICGVNKNGGSIAERHRPRLLFLCYLPSSFIHYQHISTSFQKQNKCEHRQNTCLVVSPNEGTRLIRSIRQKKYHIRSYRPTELPLSKK